MNPINKRINGLKRRRLCTALDTAMAALLPLLMAYDLIGARNHEVLGICMTVMLIIHHTLNRRWFGALRRGKYDAYRLALTACDFALLLLFAVQAISGMTLSRYTLGFLPKLPFYSLARAVHLACGYWCLTLCGIHAGLHMMPLVKRAAKLSPWHRMFAAIGVAVCFGWGICAFMRRGLLRYMTLQDMFVMFDYGEPLILFLADYLSILIMFIITGAVLGYLLRLPKRR